MKDFDEAKSFKERVAQATPCFKDRKSRRKYGKFRHKYVPCLEPIMEESEEEVIDEEMEMECVEEREQTISEGK